MTPSPRAVVLPILLAILAAWSPPASAILCPDGEVTLTSPLVRIQLRPGGRSGLAGPKSTIIVPDGLAVDPAHEPIVYLLEADGVPLHRVDLAGGTAEVNAAGTRMRLRPRLTHTDVGIRISDAVFRIDARFAQLDLPAAPPARVKQLVKIGDDCFSAVLACAARGTTVVCRPERNALLRGTVLAGKHQPLAGAMVTVFDDARLESVSVFSQQDGRFVFPPLRPGSYRFRARLVGRADLFRNPVTLRAARAEQLDVTLEPASPEAMALNLPSTHFFAPLLARWPSPTIRGASRFRAATAIRSGAGASGARRRWTSGTPCSRR